MSAPETITALQEPLTRGAVQTCAKTPARFHTDLFCSLFRAFRPLGSEKIATDFALFDQAQNFAEFSHSLGRIEPFEVPSPDDRFAQHCAPSDEGNATVMTFLTVEVMSSPPNGRPIN